MNISTSSQLRRQAWEGVGGDVDVDVDGIVLADVSKWAGMVKLGKAGVSSQG